MGPWRPGPQRSLLLTGLEKGPEVVGVLGALPHSQLFGQVGYLATAEPLGPEQQNRAPAEQQCANPEPVVSAPHCTPAHPSACSPTLFCCHSQASVGWSSTPHAHTHGMPPPGAPRLASQAPRPALTPSPLLLPPSSNSAELATAAKARKQRWRLLLLCQETLLAPPPGTPTPPSTRFDQPHPMRPSPLRPLPGRVGRHCWPAPRRARVSLPPSALAPPCALGLDP